MTQILLVCIMIGCSCLCYSCIDEGYKSVICYTYFQGIGYSLRDHKYTVSYPHNTCCCYTFIPRILKFLFTQWHSFSHSTFSFNTFLSGHNAFLCFSFSCPVTMKSVSARLEYPHNKTRKESISSICCHMVKFQL
jgi:hypothetical protein